MTEPLSSSTTVELPTSQPILIRALKISAIAGALQLLVFGAVGWVLDGSEGLAGALIGSAISILFLALTALSIVIANRFIGSEFFVVLFFVVVLGTWLLKFAGFIVAALLLRDQPWLNPTILFLSIIIGVIVSLTLDVFVVAKSRLPYVTDVKI